MPEVLVNEIEIVVHTLLHIGERVIAVSRDHVITQVWDRKEAQAGNNRKLHIGKKISDPQNDYLLRQCDAVVEKCFTTRKGDYIEYRANTDYGPVAFAVRILTIHPDRDFLFILIENLSRGDDAALVEDKWKLALDAAGDGMWDINMETDKIFFSTKWHDIFGYDEADISTGSQWAAKIHPDDLPVANAARSAYLAGDAASYVVELRYLCKDGTYKWILSRGVAISKTSDGKLLRFIGTHTDINERKNAEKRIEELRHFYENILHNIPADIAVFDANHTYLFVNRHAFKNEQLRNYMIGKTDIDYARYSNRPYSFVETRFALYDKARDEGKRTEMIERLINKDGKEEHHLRILNPVYFENGELEFLMAYGLNITDLILAQQAMKISADTFSSAFDYSGIGMALISPGGAWLDVNSVLCSLTGYTKEELMQLTYHDITYPEDDEIDRPHIIRMLNKEIANYTIEKRYVSKDKKIVLVSLTVSLVWHADGTPNFFIAQVVDITEKKQLEDEIKRKNHDLEASKISLINKVEQLEELSHIIAHNLRGPAGNIKMLSEAMIAKENDTSGSEFAKAFSQQQALQFIQESSTSLINSLATLMEITEIKLNKDIPYDTCDVSVVINDIIAQLQGIIYERQAVIKQNIGIQQIAYPKVYLENILYNFISNALKYSKKDVPPEIRISVQKEGEKIRISVKDNGLGINMQKYGDRVFKLNQVFHKGYDSKGIGLYITKTQVESLGGSIEVTSREQEGSEFIVTI